MLAEGRQSREAFQENHREGSDSGCGELCARLGEALEREVWKCQLSTCQKETGESKETGAKDPTGEDKSTESWSVPCSPVFHWIKLRNPRSEQNFGQEPSVQHS